jgi:hypothetical protein
MNPLKKKHKVGTMRIVTVILLTVPGILQAQGFSHYHVVPSRSDRDFKVQQSPSGGDDLKIVQQPNGGFVGIDPSMPNLRFNVSFDTEVRGKGKLTKLQLNSDSTALLTVEGLQDHAVWLVLMNRTSSQSGGVKLWHIGDMIQVNASTILVNDDHIPKVLSSTSTTFNLTRTYTCDGRGCFDGHKWVHDE